jgi:hypothetical protein
MKEYFDGFKWCLLKSFSEPLSKCRFEQGDIIYDTFLAYSLSWGEAREKIKNSIQIKFPLSTSSAKTTETDETIFKSNWNSEVIFDLFYYPTLEKKEIKTTQGNLYIALWKGDLSFVLDSDVFTESPLLLKDISQLPEIIQLFLPQIVSNGYEYLFFFPIDETSSISKEKASKIEKAFKSDKILFKCNLVSPTQLKLPNVASICPTVKIAIYEINGNYKQINTSLKKALYVPSKTKKTEKEVFRLKTHGTFLKENKIDPKHYFNISLKTDSKYITNFLYVFNYLRNNLTRQKIEDLLSNKLQIKVGSFNERSFIQIACETTVNSFFSRKYPNSFEYEKIVNPNTNKNVECQFKDGDFIYNVEVKCADFEKKEKIDTQDAFKFGTFGRLENYKESMTEIGDLMVEGQKKTGKGVKPLIEMRKMDNNLKDFLILAHNKFNPIPDENEVNILVVCCGDANDMQNWHNYMFAPTGLFTKDSFHNQNEYSLVDVVVLTNLYHRHYKFDSKLHLENKWEFEHAFNLAFSNPFRRLNKEKSIKHFLNTFPHYTYELAKHKITLQNEPEVMRNILTSIVGIPDFVRVNFTEKGKHLF